MTAVAESEEVMIRFNSKLSMGSCASDAPRARLSRDCLLDSGALSIHISGRPSIEAILGKPGQKVMPQEAHQIAVYGAAAAIIRALTDVGIATVRTNFRGRHQAGPDPNVSLFGAVPGLDIAGDYRKHWGDFAVSWEEVGIGTKDIYEALILVDKVLVEKMSNAKGLLEAWESIENLNNAIFRPKGISVNFHVFSYSAREGITGLFTSTTKTEGNIFFLSVTPWDVDEKRACFPGSLQDAEVNVELEGTKHTWKVCDLYDGSKERRGSK